VSSGKGEPTGAMREERAGAPVDREHAITSAAAGTEHVDASDTAPSRTSRSRSRPRPTRSPRRMLLSLVLVGVAFFVLRSRSTQEGCTRLTRTLDAPPSAGRAGPAALAAPALSAPVSAPPAPSDAPAAVASSELPPAEPAQAPACRVLEVIENGKPVAPAIGRLTFERAQRLCAGQPSPGGQPYRLSASGSSVECVCE
jgi:hypothetical protein